MPKYQFTISKINAQTMKEETFHKSAPYEAQDIMEAIEKRNEYLNSHPEFLGLTIDTPKKVGRGGARKGAGTKSPRKNGAYKGMGSKFGTETKVIRVPVNFDSDQWIENEEKILGILQAWKMQAELAKRNSKTGKIPRTFDKAMHLIKELEEELGKQDYIV